MRFRLTQRAERDLREIYRYTFEAFGGDQAEKYLLDLENVFSLIADNPEMGRLYKGTTHQFIHGKHIILYRKTKSAVTIGRLFHGARRRR